MSDRDKLLPQVLRHLRESKRMTVEMVAKHLDVQPEDIIAYEAGEKKLRPALFIGLSSLYNIPMNVFELKKPVGNSLFNYRRTVNRKLEKYSYTLYGYMNNILKIYESGKIKTFELHNTDNIIKFDKESIKNRAIELRKILKLSDSDPIPNLPKYLDDLGIEVIYTELPQGINGVSYTIERNDTNISSIVFFISNNDDLYKQSFSIAHEFGYIMMHNGIKDELDYNDELEEIANYFANVFLLPPDVIINEFSKLSKEEIEHNMNPDGKIYTICKKYGVNVKTVLWSIFHAQIIAKEELKELCSKYENLSPDLKFHKMEGVKDNYLYNNKMEEAVALNIITQNECDYITGFAKYKSSKYM